MNPKFEPTDDGLEIVDPIERHRYRLTMHEPVDPEPVETDRIQFPVTTAVEITTGAITLPTNESVYVRDEDGSMIAEVRPNKQSSLPHDTYTLDLSGPLKVYARVESSVYIYSDTERTYITLDDATQTTLGARSYHRRPAGTITTTAEPTDVMRAVSAFGSALKSTTPERSYPTHRGHPPAVELGDELAIPDKFERPETGIRIEVPRDLGDIFVVTPLAYYLGAEVVPGSEPRLVTDEGFTYDLKGDDGLESTVERVLKQVFFLDCVVRTEGPTPLPLHERREIEPQLEFDIERIYDHQLTKQLETYLSVPFETIRPYSPNWRLETSITTKPEPVSFLPFLVDYLSIIKIRSNIDTISSTAKSDAIEAFTRGNFVRKTSSTRCIDTESEKRVLNQNIVSQSLNGHKSRKIASETSLSAFHHGIGQMPREGPIEIQVVCNDSDMKTELEAVNSVYGTRDELPFKVNLNRDVRMEKLKSILSKNIDFFHFIGHIDEGGFQCTDGKLNASSVGKVGIKAFFLNACQSHTQGLHLIEKGSIGGIVTFGEILNNAAVKMGSVIARLLNQGFPLYAALDVAQEDNIVSQQYLLVGDGMITIAHSESGPPTMCSLNIQPGSVEIDVNTYTTSRIQKGGLFIPYIEENDEHFLTSGKPARFSLSKQQAKDFLKMEQMPVITDNGVKWSKEIALEQL